MTLITGEFDGSGLNLTHRGLTSRTTIDGIDIIVVKVPYGQKMSMIRRVFSFLQFMIVAPWVAVWVKHVDVVFATSTPLTIAVPGILASLFHRRPFVFEVRDLWPEIPIRLGVLKNPLIKLFARFLERVAYRQARQIVALSPGMKDGIVRSGVPAEKITVIPNSSDVALFRVAPEEGRAFRDERPEWGDGPLVVYAGAFGRVNGLEYAVKLAGSAAFRDTRATVVLAGKGSEKQGIIDEARESGVLDMNLFIIDPLPRSELARLLSAADMLASFVIPLPILEANSANKFFDAFAAGKPIAINYGGWQAEILNESGAGLVLDAHDVDRAAEQLTAALYDSEWLRCAAEASRGLGDETFDRRKLAVTFENVLLTAAQEAAVSK